MTNDQIITITVSSGVTLITFLPGYIAITKARSTRIKSANNELVCTLERRLVLDYLVPRTTEISALRYSKAIEHKVKTKNLLNEEQIIDLITARVIENEYIDESRRNTILCKLDDARRQLSVPEEMEQLNVYEDIQAQRATRRSKIKWAGALASTSVLIGIIAVTLTLAGLNLQVSTITVLTATISGLMVVFFTSFFIALKQRQERSDPDISPEDPHYERRVINDLARFGSTQYRIAGTKFRADAIVELDERTIVVEVRKNIKPVQLQALIEQLEERLSGIAYDEILIITESADTPIRLENVSIMKFKDAKEYLEDIDKLSRPTS